LKATVSAFSDEDLKKTVDRSSFTMPVELQLDVYLQALLIFFGKATIYLKTMNKALPQHITGIYWVMNPPELTWAFRSLKSNSRGFFLRAHP
jgi:hypothetical protein